MFSEWVTKKAKKILKRLTPYQKIYTFAMF